MHLKSLIDDKTKAILVNNPSNPCGSVYSKVSLAEHITPLHISYSYNVKQPHLEDILALAESNKIPIIAVCMRASIANFLNNHLIVFIGLQDEIYGDMVFGCNVFYPMATLSKTVPIIAVGGLAKQFLVPGWRVGWIIVHDRNHILRDVRTAYSRLSLNILGANSLIQVKLS